MGGAETRYKKKKKKRGGIKGVVIKIGKKKVQTA